MVGSIARPFIHAPSAPREYVDRPRDSSPCGVLGKGRAPFAALDRRVRMPQSGRWNKDGRVGGKLDYELSIPKNQMPTLFVIKSSQRGDRSPSIGKVFHVAVDERADVRANVDCCAGKGATWELSFDAELVFNLT